MHKNVNITEFTVYNQLILTLQGNPHKISLTIHLLYFKFTILIKGEH